AVIFIVIQILVVGFSWLAIRFFLSPGGLEAGRAEDEWLLRNLLISLIASLIFVRYLVLHRQWQVQVRAEAGARLEALQARIRPHFLFNTLNTIASLVRTRPDEAEQAVLDLADLLRTGLRTDAEHTLAEELELVRGYLRIESQRLGERLRIDWQIDDSLPLDQTMPALLIQPLVENAVVHGIARLPDGGQLQIAAGSAGTGSWFVRVTNPWPGSDDDEMAGGADGNRMALGNIRQRLELAWGERARLQTGATDGQFTAEIRVPASA
ncbi:MAG: histidine kinase, partial [Wenzhouxiangellaceae bacterium]